jgi:hypothetical protein
MCREICSLGVPWMVFGVPSLARHTLVMPCFRLHSQIFNTNATAVSSPSELIVANNGLSETLKSGSADGEDHERRSFLPQAGSPENASMSRTGRR